METEYRIDGDERNINVVNNDGNEDNTSIIDDTAGSPHALSHWAGKIFLKEATSRAFEAI